MFVFAFHCEISIGGFELSPWTGALGKGYLGVDFFFILSGFILAHVYGERFERGEGRYGRYLRNRLARFYPLHIATLLPAVPMIWIHYGYGRDGVFDATVSSLFGNLFMVHAWGIFDRLSWNFVSWSISAEWFAYLLFPVLLACTRFAKGRPFFALGAAFALLALFGWIVARLTGPGILVGGVTLSSSPHPDRPFDITYDFALVRVTLEFTAGVLLYRAYAVWRDRGWGRRASGLTWLGAVALAALLHFPWPGPPVVHDTLVVILVAGLLLTLALAQGSAQRFCEWRPFIYLGEISYAIYMVHGVGLVAIFFLWDLGLPGPGRMVTGLAYTGVFFTATLVGAVFLYECLEKPARAWLRGRSEEQGRGKEIASQ